MKSPERRGSESRGGFSVVATVAAAMVAIALSPETTSPSTIERHPETGVPVDAEVLTPSTENLAALDDRPLVMCDNGARATWDPDSNIYLAPPFDSCHIQVVREHGEQDAVITIDTSQLLELDRPVPHETTPPETDFKLAL